VSDSIESFYNDPKFNFTEKWFGPGRAREWEQIYTDARKKYGLLKTQRALEIGCFEGRASIFICDRMLENSGTLDVIDTFRGSDESGMESCEAGIKENHNFILDNFSHNISFFPKVSTNTYRGVSQFVLPQLCHLYPQPIYDFIYIDASHRADDTFVDFYYANRLLKKNGLIILDDYGWKDPNKPQIIDSPEAGINFLFTLYKESYHLLHLGYQAIAMKTA